MKALRIGVIGAGHMGSHHVRNLSEEKRFDLVGIYDSNSEQARTVAEKYDVTAFETADDLLKNIEAVVIAVPSSLHKEVAMKAAEYNVHALIEKPLATSSEDAEFISRTFEEKNLLLAVGHIERFNPVFRELKKLTDPGDVFYIEACRYSPYNVSGRITDTTSLHGRGEAVLSGRTDFATCLMDFGGKCHAVVNASRVSQGRERSITVHKKDSCIRADLLAKTLEIYKSADLAVDSTENNSYKQDGIVKRVYVPIEEPLRAELVAFYNSVVDGKPVEVNGDVGIRAIKICEAVARSAEAGNQEDIRK